MKKKINKLCSNWTDDQAFLTVTIQFIVVDDGFFQFQIQSWREILMNLRSVEGETHLWTSLIPAALEPPPPRGWYDIDWGGRLCGGPPDCCCRGPEMSFWGCWDEACWLVEPTWTDRIAASISFRRRHLFHDFLARILLNTRKLFLLLLLLRFSSLFFFFLFFFIWKLHYNEKRNHFFSFNIEFSFNFFSFLCYETLEKLFLIFFLKLFFFFYIIHRRVRMEMRN